MELEFFIALSAVLAVAVGYLWISLGTERKLKDAYMKSAANAWKAHDLVLECNIELHEKILRIKSVLGREK